MGVNDDGDSSLLAFNLAVHILNPLSSKVNRVEVEVLVVSLIVLIRPLDVHPQHVNRKVAFCKLFVSVNNDGRTHIIPLAVVKAKCVEKGQGYVA